jgi:hypothetical protein
MTGGNPPPAVTGSVRELIFPSCISAVPIEDTAMPLATFETLEGEDVEIDSDDVVRIKPGPELETTLIELDDGDEIVVVATELEVAAELELNPLEVIEPEDDDESIEALIEESDLDEEEET